MNYVVELFELGFFIKAVYVEAVVPKLLNKELIFRCDVIEF